MKRFVCKAIIFLFILMGGLGGQIMASPIAKTWIYATVLIENEWGQRGTGFLVVRNIEADKGRIFLCTNKHVLNEKKEMRDKAQQITCWLNVKNTDGNIIGRKFTLGLIAPNGGRRWREHPDDNIDVMAFDVTDLIANNPSIEKKWADYSLFIDEALLSKEEITIGEEIMVIGYPLGKKQGESNFPLVRQGIIATQIGKIFIEETLDEKNQRTQKTYRGFLIDGGAIPGSSGSPVVLKPVPGRLVGNSIMMDLAKPYLLGILAETRFAPIQTKEGVIPAYAGLGLVFDASTVRETIELFFV